MVKDKSIYLYQDKWNSRHCRVDQMQLLKSLKHIPHCFAIVRNPPIIIIIIIMNNRAIKKRGGGTLFRFQK